MDSHGNICGIEDSNTHMVTAADGTTKEVTNTFEYKKGAGSKGEETGGTAPLNLGKAKYGTFPRLATDLINQADKLTKPKELKFTQICVEQTKLHQWSRTPLCCLKKMTASAAAALAAMAKKWNTILTIPHTTNVVAPIFCVWCFT